MVCLGLGMALLLTPLPAAAQGPTVQAVEVRLQVDGIDPPAVIRLRLLETVGTVAQRLLVGRPVDQLRAVRTQLESTLASVITRVVGGYAVMGTSIDVSPRAMVTVRLRPDAPMIRGVDVTARTPVHPAVARLVLQPAEEVLQGSARALLVDLPVEALDWSAPLLIDEVRKAVEASIAGFTAVIRLQPGVTTRVEADLIPRDSRVIRDIGIRFRSTSIPTMLLEQHAPQVLSMAEALRGLPVAFAEQRRAALERFLSERLRAYPPVRHYDVVVEPLLQIRETTYITLVAESLTYRARLEAVVSIGNPAPDPELRARVGRLVGGIEFFGQVALVPTRFAARFDLGVRYPLSPTLDVGVTHTFSALGTMGWVLYRMNPDLSLRAGYTFQTGAVEAGLHYRFTEFLAGEIVGTSQGQYWVRLISNL